MISIPSLRGGDGLPGRQVALCDGRTTLRADNAADGYDLLTHYSPDSWGKLARVLQDPGHAMIWHVDGDLHRFEWTDVFPFGLINREMRTCGDVVSRVTVLQGVVLFELAGAQDVAEFSIPRSMFRKYDETGPNGEIFSRTDWRFAPKRKSGWHACRREQWMFRDCSTYADIAGERIASETHSSELHLVILVQAGFALVQDDQAIRFRINAKKGQNIRLAFGLGRSRKEAESLAADAVKNDCLSQQLDRYAQIDAETPNLEFGRHTAMRKFFRLFPGYLESMRIVDDPAVFRANNDYYWVWGWDMTRPAFGILTANRHRPVRDLLLHRARDGYINEYDNTLWKNLRCTSGLPGGLEYMLAHDYASWSGDMEGIRDLQPSFAKAIRVAYTKVGPTGMAVGDAASTDFPQEFGRTFRAWLAYPVSWEYGGYCGVEKLFLAWNDSESAAMASDLAQRIRRSFVPVFWNDVTGFWNEGVHAIDPDLVCDIPLSTALAAMDTPYGEDLYDDKLMASARFAKEQFLREDGVHITARGETRGWKEWTRQPNNWFAANDTMLARLFRAVGDLESLEKLFYLYEMNFGYQPAAFEGKPFRRPLHTSGSWQAFGAAAWYRNLVEGAAGLWADLGGLTLRPGGLGEPLTLTGLKCGDAIVDFHAEGQGRWVQSLTVDGKTLAGTTKLPPLKKGRHDVAVTYTNVPPAHPVLTLATDAAVEKTTVASGSLSSVLRGQGYVAISFFSPQKPIVHGESKLLPVSWDPSTRLGRTRLVLDGKTTLNITSE